MLVALIVVGLGMLAVIQTVSQTANNTSYIRDKTIAHWIAMNQLTKVRLEPNAPAVDKSSDEVKMAGRDWRWTMEVKQTPVESIRRIEVSVTSGGCAGKSSLAYITGFTAQPSLRQVVTADFLERLAAARVAAGQGAASPRFRNRAAAADTADAARAR